MEEVLTSQIMPVVEIHKEMEMFPEQPMDCKGIHLTVDYPTG